MEPRQKNRLPINSSGLKYIILIVFYLCVDNYLSAQCVQYYKYKMGRDSISFELDFISKNMLIMKLEYTDRIAYTRPSALYEDTFYIKKDSSSGAFNLEATDSSDFTFRCYKDWIFKKLPDCPVRIYQLEDSIGYDVSVAGAIADKNLMLHGFYGLTLYFSKENIPIGFDFDLSGHHTYGFLLKKHQINIIRDMIKSGCN